MAAEVSGARRPLLLVGLPRSGTTWTASVLGAAPGTRVVMEPDNEKTSAPAIRAKQGLGRFPVLAPGEKALAYERLWSWALVGAPRTVPLRVGDRLLLGSDTSEREQLVSGRGSVRTRAAGLVATRGLRSCGPDGTTGSTGSNGSHERTVAKSVHACLTVEWLASRFDLDVVVILRHPANVLASWIELDLPDSDRGLDRHPLVQERFVRPWGLPPPGPTRVERAAWQIGLLSCVLEDAARRNPTWHVRSHESLCGRPVVEFRRLFHATGLEWSADVEARLAESDRPGTAFSLNRHASELADSWRKRLSESDVSALRSVLAGFPVGDPWARDGAVVTSGIPESAVTSGADRPARESGAGEQIPGPAGAPDQASAVS